MLSAFFLVLAFLGPKPAAQASSEVPVLKVGLGTCAADFVVRDGSGKPVYLATIHARIRYGALNIKRMDVEVSTNDQGKARVEGLPSKAKPIVYDVAKDETKGTAQQDVSTNCLASLEVALK